MSQQASESHTLLHVFTSCAAPIARGIDFGFIASRVRLVNDGGVPIHFSLKSSEATTDDPELRGGESYAEVVPPTQKVSFASTSTTTSTAGDMNLVRVSAWGG